MKKYRIIYTYNRPKFGFNNSVTVTAANVDEAIKEAQNKIREHYGEKEYKYFSFKHDPIYCGVCI